MNNNQEERREDVPVNQEEIVNPNRPVRMDNQRGGNVPNAQVPANNQGERRERALGIAQGTLNCFSVLAGLAAVGLFFAAVVKADSTNTRPAIELAIAMFGSAGAAVLFRCSAIGIEARQQEQQYGRRRQNQVIPEPQRAPVQGPGRRQQGQQHGPVQELVEPPHNRLVL